MNNLPVAAENPTASWLLALDTSTEQIGIALTNGDAMIELSVPGGRQQTTSLLPFIKWLLEQQHLSIENIKATAVAIGPGSFTGLRVGLSIAKGLALAQGAAVIGIPTLEVVAWPYQSSRRSMLCAIPAGRSRFVWSVVDSDGNSAPPTNSSLDELLEAARNLPDHLIVGELPRSIHDQLTAQGSEIDSRLLGTRRAAALADLGFDRWQRGDVDDAASLEPMYLHGKQTALPPRSQR